MKMSRITTSGINAGSMADIAFLLLIFFLVTTTFPEEQQGIESNLPLPCPEGMDCNIGKRSQNVFTIAVNKNEQLLVNGKLMAMENLRESIKDFVDNNADATCDYCYGAQKSTASQHPTKALISIKTSRETPYEYYIAMQNELTGAFYELRERLSKEKFGKTVEQLTLIELKEIKASYPLQIAETEM